MSLYPIHTAVVSAWREKKKKTTRFEAATAVCVWCVSGVFLVFLFVARAREPPQQAAGGVMIQLLQLLYHTGCHFCICTAVLCMIPTDMIPTDMIWVASWQVVDCSLHTAGLLLVQAHSFRRFERANNNNLTVNNARYKIRYRLVCMEQYTPP